MPRSWMTTERKKLIVIFAGLHREEWIKVLKKKKKKPCILHIQIAFDFCFFFQVTLTNIQLQFTAWLLPFFKCTFIEQIYANKRKNIICYVVCSQVYYVNIKNEVIIIIIIITITNINFNYKRESGNKDK